jgi:hypothetical protein
LGFELDNFGDAARRVEEFLAARKVVYAAEGVVDGKATRAIN